MEIQNEMVYLVISPKQAAAKIGYTSNGTEGARERLVALQAGNPDNLDLVAIIPGDESTEFDIHSLFYKECIRGEWFRLCPEMFEYFGLVEGEYTENGAECMLPVVLKRSQLPYLNLEPEYFLDRDDDELLVEVRKLRAALLQADLKIRELNLRLEKIPTSVVEPTVWELMTKNEVLDRAFKELLERATYLLENDDGSNHFYKSLRRFVQDMAKRLNHTQKVIGQIG